MGITSTDKEFAENFWQLQRAREHIRLKHITALDGVRGLAILYVVWHNVASKLIWHDNGLFRTLLKIASDAGWVGVQLFFVLSGFLITGILIDKRGTPNAFRNFIARRALRIFPVYYVALIILFWLLPFLGYRAAWLDESLNVQAWYWTYLVNWITPFKEIGGLSHFWSLAIEEQFYLIWPLLVLSLSNKTLASVCCGLVGLALGSRAILLWQFPAIADNATYTFLITRCDALALGALLAIALRDEQIGQYFQKWFKGCSIAVLLLVVVVVLRFHYFDPIQSDIGALNQTLAAWLSLLLVYYAVYTNGNLSGVLGRLLQLPVLQSCGKYSYAIYIVHRPITYFWLHNFDLGTWLAGPMTTYIAYCGNIVAVFVLSFFVALISWVAIEQPFLRMKGHFS